MKKKFPNFPIGRPIGSEGMNVSICKDYNRQSLDFYLVFPFIHKGPFKKIYTLVQ